jgi:Cell division protein FtsQ
VRRWLAVAGLAVVAVVAAYWLLVRDTAEAGSVYVPEITATIGSGEDAVGVSESGQVVTFLAVPPDAQLPQLPLEEVPKSGRLAGPVLEQAKVLGAAPPALRPYVERSYYGESGIDVDLTSGIELRFGDDSQAQRKWHALAAILADPSITALDYVDLHAPGRPSYGGEGHLLPAVE